VYFGAASSCCAFPRETDINLLEITPGTGTIDLEGCCAETRDGSLGCEIEKIFADWILTKVGCHW
jgi:hypothetical protein